MGIKVRTHSFVTICLALSLKVMAEGGPSHPVSAGALGSTETTRIQRLSTFRLAPNGNILACDAKAEVVKVISPSDELVATWTLPFAPSAVHALDEDTIFVGGSGRVARLDKTGKVVKELDLASIELPKARVPCVTASDKDLFVAVRIRTGFAVYRFDHQLQQPRKIIEGLRGCCGQMDIHAANGKLYVAENARFSVKTYDADGKQLASWGKPAREGKEWFSGCCNPKNICIGPDGMVYTADSPSGIVKRFTLEGKYLGLVGTAEVGAGCVHAAVFVSADGRRVYVCDTTKNVIRVLETPPAAQFSAPVGETKGKG